MKIFTAERSDANSVADNPIFQRHVFAYNQAAQLISGTVLEIGCGTGYGIPILAPKATDYHAVDKFATKIDNQSLPNVHFKQTEVPLLPGFADNTFDCVVSFQVIEHIEDDHLFIKEIKRVLKPGGVFICTTPNKAMSLTRNPWHVREYKIAEMKALIAQYFTEFNLNGIYGNEKVMQYYEKNKESVHKFTRFDIFDLQYKLPRQVLQLPYDLANRLNRILLSKANSNLVHNIQATDFFLKDADNLCFDYFIVAKK